MRVLVEACKTGNRLEIYLHNQSDNEILYKELKELKDHVDKKDKKIVITFDEDGSGNLIAKLFNFLVELQGIIERIEGRDNDNRKCKWFRYFEVSGECISEIHNFGNT